MTVTTQLQARQAADGAPIDITVTWQKTSGDDNDPANYLGLTTTATQPATFSALTASVGFYDYDDMWDSAQNDHVGAWSGGTVSRSFNRHVNRMFKRLDATFAAGRYLWLLGYENDPPAGGDAPLYVSGPYLIH